MRKKEPTDDLVHTHLKILVQLSQEFKTKKDIKDWQEFTKAMSSMVQVLPLHTVIALHFHQAVQPLLRAVHLLWKSSKIQNLSQKCTSEIKNIMQSIYENCYQCFLKKQKKEFAQIVNDMINQKIIIVQENSKNSMVIKDNRTLVIRHLLERLYEFEIKRSSSTSHKARGQLNEFIEKELLVEDAHCLLQQIVLNWIKQKTQLIQGERKEYICCKIHFEYQANRNMSGFSQAADQEFKDYRWPLQNQSIKFHLTKTIVGYLNTTGGIIYVGMKQDKSKMVEVKGIKLTNSQKLDFLYFIHDDILNGVYPKSPERIYYQQEKMQLSKQKQKVNLKMGEEEAKKYPYINRLHQEFTKNKSLGYEYRINQYINIDFLDVYDQKTNLNVEGLYVIRIKIKVGDSRELYHIINKEGIPETYLREDKSVKKKSIAEFYKQFGERMSGFTAKGRQNEKNEKHAYCRFQPLQNGQIRGIQNQEMEQRET